MYKFYLSLLFLSIVALTAKSQKYEFCPAQQEMLDNLYQNNNGTNWNYSLKEMWKRSESPRLTLKDGAVSWNSIGVTVLNIVDLSNNNLTGRIDPIFAWNEKYSGKSRFVFQPDYQVNLIFSYNQIEELPAEAILAYGSAGAVHTFKFDHNKLQSLNLTNMYERSGSGVSNNRGSFVFEVQQNEIKSLNKDELGRSLYSGSMWTMFGAIDNSATSVRIDNNRLNMGKLIESYKVVMSFIGNLGWRYPGIFKNPDIPRWEIFDYLPQKPWGEFTEQTENLNNSVTLAIEKSHPKNVYQWQLNGKDMPLSNEPTKTFSVSATTAGVWRCKVTNPDLPKATIYCADKAVWLNKGNNQAVSDISFGVTKLNPALPEGSIIGDFSATDPNGDEVFFRLVDGEKDNGSFRITDCKTLITAEEMFPYFYKTEYEIVVEAYDIYGGKYQKTFTFSKGNASTEVAPDGIFLSNNSVEENLINIEIGNFTVKNRDADNPDEDLVAGYTFAIEKIKDFSYFKIVGSQLQTSKKLDYETKKEFNIRVAASKGDMKIMKDFTITCTNGNDKPSNILLNGGEIEKNKVPGTLVGMFFASDPDGDEEFTFSLVDGEGADNNADFFLEGNKIKNKVKFIAVAEKSIRVKAADASGAEFEKSFTVNIIEPPVDPNQPYITFSRKTVAENTALNTVIADLAVENSDKQFAFSLPVYNDNKFFSIDGNKLKLKKSIDFEEQQIYQIKVVAASNSGNINVVKEENIVATNVNESPVSLAFTNTSVQRAAAINSLVSELVTIDPDAGDNHTYELSSEDQYFKIEEKQLLVKSTLSGISEKYNLTIVSKDKQDLKCESTISLSIMNEAYLSLSNTIIEENSAAESTVGTIGVVGSTADYSFSLPTYGDNGYFKITGSKLQCKKSLNFEEKAIYNVKLVGTSTGSKTIEKEVKIFVTNVNEAPQALSFSNTAISKNLATDGVICCIYTIDPDAGDSHTYSLAESNQYFKIENNNLKAKASLEGLNEVVTLNIVTTDAGGLKTTQALALKIIDGKVSDVPVQLSFNYENLSGSVNAGDLVAKISVNSSDAWSYTTNSSDFSIEGNLVKAKQALSKAMYAVEITATNGTHQLSATAVIRIQKQNSKPIAIGLDNFLLNKSWAAGTRVAMLFMNDPDGDVPTFELLEGTDCFELEGNVLKIKALTDETVYTIKVKASDGVSAIEQSFDLYVPVVVSGVNQINSKKVKAYPNPVTDKVNLEFTGSPKLYIYNSYGVLIKSFVAKPQVDISDLAAGLYLFHLDFGDRNEVVRIIKK